MTGPPATEPSTVRPRPSGRRAPARTGRPARRARRRRRPPDRSDWRPPPTTATPSSVAGSYFCTASATVQPPAVEGEHAGDLGVEVVVEHDAVLGRELDPVAGRGQREVGDLRAPDGVDDRGVPVGAVGHEHVPAVLGQRAEVGGPGLGQLDVVAQSSRPTRRDDERAVVGHRGVHVVRCSATPAGAPWTRAAGRRRTSRPSRAVGAELDGAPAGRRRPGPPAPWTSTSCESGRRQVVDRRAWPSSNQVREPRRRVDHPEPTGVVDDGLPVPGLRRERELGLDLERAGVGAGGGAAHGVEEVDARRRPRAPAGARRGRRARPARPTSNVAPSMRAAVPRVRSTTYAEDPACVTVRSSPASASGAGTVTTTSCDEPSMSETVACSGDATQARPPACSGALERCVGAQPDGERDGCVATTRHATAAVTTAGCDGGGAGVGVGSRSTASVLGATRPRRPALGGAGARLHRAATAGRSGAPSGCPGSSSGRGSSAARHRRTGGRRRAMASPHALLELPRLAGDARRRFAGA